MDTKQTKEEEEEIRVGIRSVPLHELKEMMAEDPKFRIEAFNLREMVESIALKEPDNKEHDTPEWKGYREKHAKFADEKVAFLEYWNTKWEKDRSEFKKEFEIRRAGAYEEWKRHHPEPKMPSGSPPILKEGKTCFCGKCKK